jgi:hypothetical protein
MHSKITFALVLCVLLKVCSASISDNKVIQLVDTLDHEKTLLLFGGLVVEKTARDEDKPRGFESLTERLYRYFNTHSLVLKDVDQETGETSPRSLSLHKFITKSVKKIYQEKIYSSMITENANPDRKP